MRIRQVRPEFWADEKMGQLPDGARLFYIGLWNMADDEGWIAWKAGEAGALLYPHKSPVRRVRDIETWLQLLRLAERVVLWDCGCLHVLKLKDHQRISGVPSTRVRDLHQTAHKAATQLLLSAKQSPLTRPDKQLPLSHSPVEVGRGRLGRGRLNEAVSLTSAREAARAVADGLAKPLRRTEASA